MAFGGGGGIRQQVFVDGEKDVVAAFNNVENAGEKAFKTIDVESQSATKSLRQFTRETTGMRKATSQLFKNFGDLSRGLESVGGLLGSTLGGVAGGVIGVGLAKVIGGVIDSLDGVSDRLTRIQKQAQDMAARPVAVQAASEITARQGLGGDIGERALAGMNEQFQKAKTEVQDLGTEGVKVLRGMGDAVDKTSSRMVVLGANVGSVVTVMRGGAPAAQFDLANPLKTIGVSLKGFKDNALDAEKANRLILQGFIEFSKHIDPTSQKLNELSKVLFKGVPAESMLKAAPALLAQTQAKIEELQKSDRGATDPALDAVQRRNAARAVRQQMFDELTSAVSNFYIRLDAIAIEAQNRFVSETLPKWTADISSWFSNSFSPTMQSAWTSFIDDLNKLWVANNWATLWDDLSNGFLTVAETIGEAFGNMLKSLGDRLASWAQTAWDAIKRVGSAAGTALGTAAAPFAMGGMVHGPGTGTSDSILARLSTGEFVMRAAAVDHWGAGLLASMNRAAGGLSTPMVPRRAGRFAEGGMVMAGSSGTPVHLHLGGSEFALSGSTGVVSRLVKEAHRQHMRSAGVKPSWYGGR